MLVPCENIVLCLVQEGKTATRTCLCATAAGSWNIESVVYCFAILLLALVEIQRLLCEYGIDEFRRVAPNEIQHLNGLASLTPERTDILSGRTWRIIQPHHVYWVRKYAWFQNEKYPHGQCHDVYSSSSSSSTNYLHGDHDCGYPWHCSIETRGASVAPNDKIRYRRGTSLSFQTSPSSSSWWTYPCLKAPRRMHMAC